MIKCEIKMCSTKTDSILNSKEKHISDFPWESVKKEIIQVCPALYTILQAATTSPVERSHQDEFITVLVAMLCKFRCSRIVRSVQIAQSLLRWIVLYSRSLHCTLCNFLKIGSNQQIIYQIKETVEHTKTTINKNDRLFIDNQAINNNAINNNNNNTLFITPHTPHLGLPSKKILRKILFKILYKTC